MSVSSKNKGRKFERKDESDMGTAFVKSTVWGLIVSIALSLILSLVLSFLLLLTPDPDSLTSLAAYLVTGISLFAGGIVAVRMSDALLSSVLTGVLYTVIAFSAHLIINAKGTGECAGTLLMTAYPLVSLIGGFVGRKRDNLRRKHFKNQKRFSA